MLTPRPDDRGYLSPYFINNQVSQQVELENPLILINEKKIANIRELLPVLEGVARMTTRPSASASCIARSRSRCARSSRMPVTSRVWC